MFKYSRKIENYDSSDKDSTYSLWLFLLFSLMLILFIIFLLLNVGVKQFLYEKDNKILELSGIKQKQEQIINKKEELLNEASSEMANLTKDLKDRINANKYLNQTLGKEKEEKEKIQSSLNSLEKSHEKVVGLAKNSEKSNDELSLELQLEKEQTRLLTSKNEDLQNKYDLKLSELKQIEESLKEEKQKYNDIYHKYSDSLKDMKSMKEQIEFLEGEIVRVKSQNSSIFKNIPLE